MPESDTLGPAGQLSSPTEVDVTGHLSWAGFLGVPLTTVDIVWSEARHHDRPAYLKSIRMTTRRTVGLLTSLNPAAVKMLRLPTYSSPHVISCPGCVIIG